MVKKIVLALAMFLFCVGLVHAQSAPTLSLATGLAGGTYARIGEDIRGLVEKEGMTIRSVTSNGSFDNIEMLGKGEVELAIVQLDALRYFADIAQVAAGVNVFKRLKVVLNLYPEEIHILTNKPDISLFYHLEGRKITKTIWTPRAIRNGRRRWSDITLATSATLPPTRLSRPSTYSTAPVTRSSGSKK